jgi:hypothetical protein
VALITPVQVREGYMPKLTGDAKDAVLTDIIARVESALAAWCGWPPSTSSGSPTFETATYTIYLDGPREGYPMEIQLPVCPVQSITTVHDDPDWGYSSTYLVASGDYVLDEDNGRVLLTPSSGESWSTSRRAIKAVFVAGWTTAPADLEHALCLAVAHVWSVIPRQGKQSATAQGRTDAYSPETWPSIVRQAMSRFRAEGAFIG